MPIMKFLDQANSKNLTLDGVITDSPYDHLEKHRAVGTTTRLVNQWFQTMTVMEIKEVMEALFQLLSKGSHVYFWGNTESVYDFKPLLESIGYTYNNTLFWVKTDGFGLGYSYRNDCEPILFLSKGTRREIRDKGQKNVFNFPRPKKMPPYAKPPLIYERILNAASRSDEVWLDPFAGTDPLGVANHETRMFSVKEEKGYDHWQVHTISVDIKYPKEAYPFKYKPLTEINSKQKPVET